MCAAELMRQILLSRIGIFQLAQLGKFLRGRKKFADLTLKRDSKLDQRRYGCCTFAVLDHPNMSSIEWNTVSQLILAQPSGLPYLTNPRTYR